MTLRQDLMRVIRAVLIMVNTTFLILGAVSVLLFGPMFFITEDAGSQLAILLITMLASLIMISTATGLYHLLGEKP